MIIWVAWNLNKSQYFEQAEDFYIPQRSKTVEIVKGLNKYGMMQPSWFFEIALKVAYKFSGKTIQPGYYELEGKMSNLDLITKILSGDSKTARVTIPEGLNIWEIASIIQAKAKIDSADFVDLALHYNQDHAIKNSNGNGLFSIEGYLKPDTYFVNFKYPANKFLEKLISEQEKFWNSDNSRLLKQSKYTKHQILTLASIVQAESGNKEEMPKIAGLYINRLKQDMLLQADPTVQYAIKSKKRLNYQDLDADNQYNTYKYKGLPPGPINNPGFDAIKAVLNYEKHGYIYMVAIGDGSGKHNFASSFAEHNKNVAEYRKRR